jgi:cytochrome c
MKRNLMCLVAAAIGLPAPLASAADDFDRGLKLAEQKGCMDCHALGRSYVGPSFAAIAKHYQSTPDYRARLSYIIRGGSAGHWGDRFVMWPQASITDQEIRQLIDWIVSQ